MGKKIAAIEKQLDLEEGEFIPGALILTGSLGMLGSPIAFFAGVSIIYCNIATGFFMAVAFSGIYKAMRLWNKPSQKPEEEKRGLLSAQPTPCAPDYGTLSSTPQSKSTEDTELSSLKKRSRPR